MRVYTAPETPRLRRDDKTVFLAGSIEMGAADEWQDKFIKKAQLALPDDWVILNPRRAKWDSSLEQSITNPVFYQQVDWELNWLSRANHIIFNFVDNTMSPVSLLELGAFGSSYSSFVVCGKDYKRRGNVEIFCQRNGILIYDDLDEVLAELISCFYMKQLTI